MATLITPLSGWGRYPVQSCELQRPERYADLKPDAVNLITRGQGRAYGDAALNETGRSRIWRKAAQEGIWAQPLWLHICVRCRNGRFVPTFLSVSPRRVRRAGWRAVYFDTGLEVLADL